MTTAEIKMGVKDVKLCSGDFKSYGYGQLLLVAWDHTLKRIIKIAQLKVELDGDELNGFRRAPVKISFYFLFGD